MDVQLLVNTSLKFVVVEGNSADKRECCGCQELVQIFVNVVDVPGISLDYRECCGCRKKLCRLV